MQTEIEMMERIEIMAENEFDDWDFSPNDTEALRWGAKKLRSQLSEQSAIPQQPQGEICPECGSNKIHIEGYHCESCNHPWLVH